MARRPSAYLVAALIGLAAATAAHAQQSRGNRTEKQSEKQSESDKGPILVTPNQMKWISVANMPGLSEAWIVGSANKPGPYVVRRHLEQGGQIPPRADPQTIFLTVLSGEVYIGNDDEIDPRAAMRCPEGSFIVFPGGSFHYVWARHTEAVIQEWGDLAAEKEKQKSSKAPATNEPNDAAKPMRLP